MDLKKCFKAPRKLEQSSKIQIDSSCTSTEEISMEGEEPGEIDTEFLERIYRQEVQIWLDINAKALFGLETTRFLAKEAKAKKGLTVVRK